MLNYTFNNTDVTCYGRIVCMLLLHFLIIPTTWKLKTVIQGVILTSAANAWCSIPDPSCSSTAQCVPQDRGPTVTVTESCPWYFSAPLSWSTSRQTRYAAHVWAFEVSSWMWQYGRGQPRLVSVSEAEARSARRKERMSEARRQGAETLKRRRAERGNDFYERQRSRQSGQGKEDEQWNLWPYSMLYNALKTLIYIHTYIHTYTAI